MLGGGCGRQEWLQRRDCTRSTIVSNAWLRITPTPIRSRMDLSEIKGPTVTPPQSQQVFVALGPQLTTRLSEALRELCIVASFWPGGRMRWVTHLDVNRAAVDEAIAAVREIAESRR
jgi:hypothetical protein